MPATAHAAWWRWPVRLCSAPAAASAARAWPSRRARRARSSLSAKRASARAATMRSPASSARPLTRLRPRRSGWRSEPPSPQRACACRRRRLAFERALPRAHRDVDRPHLDAVLARIAHQLRRRVEAHRLGVEQAAQERIGVVALDPAADVGEQREAGGVALRKAVLAEALDLLEDALGVLDRRSPSRPSCRPGACGTATGRRAASTPPSRGAARRPRRR